jgi:hypothetical protein
MTAIVAPTQQTRRITDCQSVRASFTRSNPVPATSFRGYLRPPQTGLNTPTVHRASEALSKATQTVSRSAGKRCPSLSSVSSADLCPRSFCTTLTLAPSLMAGEAQVCQPVGPRSTLDQQNTLRTGDEGASNMRRCRVSAAIQPLDQANATRTRIPGAAGSRMLDVGDHHADSDISRRLRNRRGICFLGCLRARTRPRRRRCESSR